MWDLLATIFIIFAAFLMTTKHIIKPKVRIGAFMSYMGACISFMVFGLIVGSLWLIIQQVILSGFNIRGIYIAIKELRGK
ncbi:hypothetical protein LCGC14_1094500 [marine sediment metagenome]|uniref:Uncharacterized protein n=1 Tax=marine sediment metagenome TaxID=412755 RepID=A0A0F9PUH1_9ZZZZ